MVCSATKPAVYRPRRPRDSPLYRTIEHYLPEFERTYEARFARRYGPWRSIIGDVARRFLRCGDLHFGFARVRCPDCHHEIFVAFSCQQRCLGSSCHQKRTILAAETIAQTICSPVPHRQLVFTIAKRLRIYCRYDRRLLGGLARAAWRATVEVYRQELKRRDLTPGMVTGIQTFGELIHFHPHIHTIVTDGAFTLDGTFICLPRIDTRRLLVAWQNNVFALFLAEDKINQETIDLMRSWRHSGFSVDNSVYLSPRDTAGLKCPECGGAMKIISFIERRQTNVIQQILRHCGLWQGFIRTHASPRAPPTAKSPMPTAPCDFVLVPDGDFLEAEFRETQAEASREFQLVLDPEFL